MPLSRGSTTRNGHGEIWTLLQARVRPDLMDALRSRARLSAVSYSLYVETLIDAAVQEDGQLPSYDALASKIAGRSKPDQSRRGALETGSGTQPGGPSC